MQTYEKTHETYKPFTERYFDARTTRLAGDAGRIACSEAIGLDRRFDAEVVSGFAEALDGRVRSNYSFEVVDGKIVADDGEPLETMMLRSRMKAYEIAAQNPLMRFVVDRFEAEIEELHAQQAMTLHGATYNTIITNSPMTFELQDSPQLLKAGYQRPDLKRSMSRISHWDGKRMHIFTRSLDSSSLDVLSQATYDAIGHRYVSSGSIGMLKERIGRQLSLEQARELSDEICHAYDKRLNQKTGLHTDQGSLPINNTDLMEFVESHPDVLANIRLEVDVFLPKCRTYTEFENELKKCLYRHLALYDEMLHGRAVEVGDISSSASDAGGRATESGVVYSMCGELLSSESNQASQQTGFESLMAYSGRRVQCPRDGCKKFVVVEDKFLRDGVLHCKACKHTFDVCGDTNKARRIKKSEMKKAIKAEEQAMKRAKSVLNPKRKSWWN